MFHGYFIKSVSLGLAYFLRSHIKRFWDNRKPNLKTANTNNETTVSETYFTL